MGAIATVLRVLYRPGRHRDPAGRRLLRDPPADGRPLADRTVRYVPTAGEWTADVVAGARLVMVETPSNPGMDVCDIAAIAEARARRRRAARGGQHDRDPAGPAAARARRGPQRGQRHEGTVRAQRRRARPRVVRRRRTGQAVAHRAADGVAWRRDRSRRGWRTAASARWTCGWPGRRRTRPRCTEVLRDHPLVTGLRWPGFAGDPGHALASRQMRRFGGVFSFALPSREIAEALVDGSRLLAAATSFGGLHSSVDRRAQWGDPVPDGFVRFSCGTEDTARSGRRRAGVTRSCPVLGTA